MITECYDCKSVEIISFGMEGKRCGECNGKLIPYSYKEGEGENE